VPNSEFIPQTVHNEDGFVTVDEFLRVKGVSDIWAAGDVADAQSPQIVHAGKSTPRFLAQKYTDSNQKIAKQAAAVYKNLDLIFKGGKAVAYVPDATRKLALPSSSLQSPAMELIHNSQLPLASQLDAEERLVVTATGKFLVWSSGLSRDAISS
jgi:hypothetical protein